MFCTDPSAMHSFALGERNTLFVVGGASSSACAICVGDSVETLLESLMNDVDTTSVHSGQCCCGSVGLQYFQFHSCPSASLTDTTL